MKARDWFILTFSFGIGAFCGLYLYVTVFKPAYDKDTLPEEIAAGDLSIIGIEYAEGSENPAYFRVKEDGSFDYIERNSPDDEKMTGNLPDDLFNRLINGVGEADLENLSLGNISPDTNVICAGAGGETNYEYNIVYEEVEYTLDTCVTNFSNDTALGQTLEDVWQYLESPEEFRVSVQNSPDLNGVENAGEKKSSAWTLRAYFERGFEEAGFQDD